MNLKAKKKSLKAQIRQRSTILDPHKRNQAKWKCIQTIPLRSFSISMKTHKTEGPGILYQTKGTITTMKVVVPEDT